MADNTIQVPQFDLGIENSQVLGNLKDAEAFLSDAAPTDNNLDADDLEEVDEEAEAQKKLDEAKRKKAEKAKVPPKKTGEDLVNSLLEKKEDDEEEVAEEDNIEEGKDKKEGNKTPKKELSDNEFENLSRELYTLNVLTPDEEGQEPVLAKTGEEFLALFNKESQKKATSWLENFLAQHGEDRRELFDAIFINGVDPKEYIPVYTQAQALEGADLTQENVQEKVMREYLTRTGYPADKIDSKIEKLKQTADLEEEAAIAHPLLVAQDKQKAKDIEEASANKLQAQKEIDDIFRTSLSKVLTEKGKGKDWDGIPITPKLVQEVFDFQYTKKWKTADGQLLTDFDKFILETKKPENIEKRIKIALLEKTGWDFSKIEKKAVSKQSSSLFASLTQKEAKQKQQQTAQPSGW